MAGKLYLCATPIGNLEDITFRVIRTLKEVDLIAAEDTRNSIKLLNHFEISTPMTSYHEYNKIDKGHYLIGLMQQGQQMPHGTGNGGFQGRQMGYGAANAGAQAVRPAQTANQPWICPACHVENTGKFCSECGKPRPSVEWTCPNCGTVNKGKFCSECGSPRGEA